MLYLKSGALAPIDELTLRPVREMVYNFQVEELESYAVGAGAVLVHNNPAIVVGSNPSRVTFEGFEVRAVHDFSHISDSILLAMAEIGFAPKLTSGQPTVLHHHQQNPAGPIIEMPANQHSIGHPAQHPYGNTPGSGLTPEQRADFDRWRERYWRERARQELRRRGMMC